MTLDSIPPAFALFAALLVLGGIAYLFAKETKGMSLDSIWDASTTNRQKRGPTMRMIDHITREK